MRFISCLPLLALACGAARSAPVFEGPTPGRSAEMRRASADDDDAERSYVQRAEARTNEALERNRREQEQIRVDIAAAARKKDDEEQRGKAMAVAAEAQRIAAHRAECAASFPKRLGDAKALLPQVAFKKATIVNRCRALQLRCAISNGQSACAGVSADDAQFFESLCMSLPYADQITMIDETHDCDDVDPVRLYVSLAATTAELDAIRNAKP